MAKCCGKAVCVKSHHSCECEGKLVCTCEDSLVCIKVDRVVLGGVVVILLLLCFPVVTADRGRYFCSVQLCGVGAA